MGELDISESGENRLVQIRVVNSITYSQLLSRSLSLSLTLSLLSLSVPLLATLNFFPYLAIHGSRREKGEEAEEEEMEGEEEKGRREVR